MFDWLGDIFSGIGNAIGSTFEALGEQISNVIWNTMLQWLYETIYNAVADFFTMMGNMGADIFQLDWIQATIRLFTLFGWALFAAGVVVAIFDVAIEYQCGQHQDNGHQYSERLLCLLPDRHRPGGTVQILRQPAEYLLP